MISFIICFFNNIFQSIIYFNIFDVINFDKFL